MTLSPIYIKTRASTVPKNWEFVRVCTICTSPYPYKNWPSYHKIVLNRTFVDALGIGVENVKGYVFGRASTVTKNWKFVRVCTICTSPYPYKNRPSYRKIVLNRTFVDALFENWKVRIVTWKAYELNNILSANSLFLCGARWYVTGLP